MAAPIADGTDVWVVVPASPPLRLTIRACLENHCRECGLPVYRCESEGGQMLSPHSVLMCGAISGYGTDQLAKNKAQRAASAQSRCRSTRQFQHHRDGRSDAAG
jgi:hypothetical protein